MEGNAGHTNSSTPGDRSALGRPGPEINLISDEAAAVCPVHHLGTTAATESCSSWTARATQF